MANWYLNSLMVFGDKKERDRFNKKIIALFDQGPFRDYSLQHQGRGFSHYVYGSRNGPHYDLLEAAFKQFPKLRFQLYYSNFLHCIQAFIISQGAKILDYRKGELYDNDYNPIDIGLPEGWKTVGIPIREDYTDDVPI